MNWQAPGWFAVAMLAAVLLAVSVWAGVWRRNQQRMVATPVLWLRWMGGEPTSGSLRLILISLAALLAAGGAARPHGNPSGLREAIPATVVVALDVSNSMLAADVFPDRLSRGTSVVRTAFAGRATGLLGVVAGGTAAFPVVPLTSDYEGALAALRRNNWPEEHRRGTDLAALLAAAGSSMAGPAGPRVIVLLSDGEEWTGDSAAMASVLRRSGIRILALLAGRPTGAPVPTAPLRREDPDATTYFRREDGSLAMSRAHPEILARITGDPDLIVDVSAPAAAERLAALLADTRTAVGGERGVDLSPWFFLPAALFATTAFFLWPWRKCAASAGIAGLALLAACSPSVQVTGATDWCLLRDQLSERLQAEPRNRSVRLSWATAAAACGDADGEEVLEAMAHDPQTAAIAWFNLGTVRLLRGDGTAAVVPLQRAVMTDQKFTEAWHNLELASALLLAAASHSDPFPGGGDILEQVFQSAAQAALVQSPAAPVPTPSSFPGGPPW